MFDIIIVAVIAIPLLVMAVFLLMGKGAFLIAGFNTMSDQEKQVYNEKTLCRAVGKLLIAITMAMALFPVSIRLEAMWLFWLAIALSTVLPIGFLIYANTGNRYRKPVVESEAASEGERAGAPKVAAGAMSRGKKVGIALTVVFSTALIVGIAAMFVSGEREPNIIIHSDSLQIRAMYGTQIPFSNITGITLDSRSMSEIGAGRRTNGYATGATLRGHFSSVQHGSKLLFVTSTSSPTIRIDRELGGSVFISYRDEGRAAVEYRLLTQALDNSKSQT